MPVQRMTPVILQYVASLREAPLHMSCSLRRQMGQTKVSLPSQPAGMGRPGACCGGNTRELGGEGTRDSLTGADGMDYE